MFVEALGARVFSIEEANALLPRLARMVEAQLHLGEEIQSLVTELWSEPGVPAPAHGAEGEDVVDVTVYPEDNGRVRELKRMLSRRAQAYREGWQAVKGTGAVVKDATTGLIDFYGRVDDRLVWLCWRFGEPAIEYYHELDRGFDGRKPLAEARKRMLN
jgi:hypothetical protein